jgi:hypothetical protein
MSDNLSLPSSRSMFGVLLVDSEELDIDMFRIIISLFVIAYLCWWIRGVGRPVLVCRCKHSTWLKKLKWLNE